jgi:hypothetical protein
VGAVALDRLPPGWEGLMSAREWRELVGYLTASAMRELCRVLAECPPARRAEIVEELRRTAPGFGDRGIVVALARVAGTPRGPLP